MLLLYSLEPLPFNFAAVACDCLAHRFGNAADQPCQVPRYPSDMSDAEWQVVRESLPVPGRTERPTPPSTTRKLCLTSGNLRIISGKTTASDDNERSLTRPNPATSCGYPSLQKGHIQRT